MIQKSLIDPTSSYHDHEFYSVFFGEPFMFGDFIYYFDGKSARIIGYDKHGNAISESQLGELLKTINLRYKAGSVWLECPSPLKHFRISGVYKRATVHRPIHNYDYEIIIQKEGYNYDILCKNKKKYSNKGLQIQVSQVSLTYKHMLMIERYLKRWRSKTFYKSEYVSSIFFLANRETSSLLSCYYENRLMGFSIISSVKKLGMLNIHVTLNEKSGISDLLYAEAIETLFKGSIDYISLGFSMNQGLFNFKNKWGGIKHWKGGYEILWYKNSRVPSYLWTTRVIRNL